MDNTVKKKLSVFRKRQTVFVIIYGLINAVVIAGIIVYYRLKEQVLAGALYLQDNAYGEAFVRKMFSSGITISERVGQPWKVPDTAAMAFRI